MTTAVRIAWTGFVLAALGAAASLWSAGQLAQGAPEILQHWWSTLAIAPLIGGFVVLAVALARLSRS